MKRRTIICLGAKRSGTTAVHRVFQKHPDVGICHPDQSIRNWELLSWNLSDELQSTAQKYGYNIKERPLRFVVARKIRPYTAPVSKRIKRGISAMKNAIKRIAKKIFLSSIERFPAKRFESIIIGLIGRRSEKLPAEEALRFLFRLDKAIYQLEGKKAIEYGGGTHTKHSHIGYHEFFVKNIGSGDRVLDIGSGIGALAYDIAERSGAIVVGIDISERNIEHANSRYSHPGVEYILGDAFQGFPSGRFDVVVLSNVIEHIDNRVGFMKKVLKEIRPKRVLVRAPLFERDWRIPLKKELGLDYYLDPTHFIEYTEEGFEDEMKRAGLKIVFREVRWGEIWAVLERAEGGK